jgi:hypothetical protein
MERRNNPAVKPCRGWKDICRSILYAVNLILIGVIVVVLLLKYVFGVLHGVPAWIPRATFAVGFCSISVALCMEDE